MKNKLKIRDRAKLRVSDRFELPTESTRILTDEGYLKATAAVTRVGVQYYAAYEFGVEDSDEMIGVFRPPETVFHAETISSLRMKPITYLHPEEDVTAKNYSRLSIGTVGETVEPISSEILGAGIQITDAEMVQKIQSRDVEELSLGYDCYIVSEEGEYMGEKYLYRFDGPMLNNHLALVPEGRCGDTVKILDQGGNTVTKKKAVKALRDAGISEEKIKAFMKDAKDDDPVDLGAFAKMFAGKDIDMTALLPALVEKLTPAMEEMAKSPEFVNAVAAAVAEKIAGQGGGEMPDGDAEDPNKPPEEMDQAAMDAKVKDAAKSRASVIAKASVFIHDDAFKIHDATDDEIVKKALASVGFTDEKLKDKDMAYMLGVLDTICEDRDAAGRSFRANDAGISDEAKKLSGPLTGISIKKIVKRG